jgi:hypothetical protein
MTACHGTECTHPSHARGAAGPWRTGRKLGRTIYVQLGPEPSDHDELVAMAETPELARLIVNEHNTSRHVR